MEQERKRIYLPCWIEVTRFLEEDVIRTSYVDDNYDGWEDDNAHPIGGF